MSPSSDTRWWCDSCDALSTQRKCFLCGGACEEVMKPVHHSGFHWTAASAIRDGEVLQEYDGSYPL